MRIDAHQHFWRYKPATHPWITDDMAAIRRDFLPIDLRSTLLANDVCGTVAVQADQSENETRFLLDLAGADDRILGVVGWIDLRAATLLERLEYFARFDSLVGFRHIVQSEPDDRFLLGADFLRGISHLERYGFTYDILINPRQLPAAVQFVEKFPAQRFVLDHLAKPDIRSGKLDGWQHGIGALAAHPNVFCKLSGMVTEASWSSWHVSDFRPYLDLVFEAFGVDRLMFGSDWPVCLVAASYGRVLGLVDDYLQKFSPADRDKIFFANAARFYGLETPAHGSAAQG
ncbi:MAG: amidohydrolase family protein [Candidatus Acidiferrales bacterium]